MAKIKSPDIHFWALVS